MKKNDLLAIPSLWSFLVLVSINAYTFGWAAYDLFLTEHDYYEEDDEREDKIAVWVTLIYSGCFLPMAIMILYTHISYTNFRSKILSKSFSISVFHWQYYTDFLLSSNY